MVWNVQTLQGQKTINNEAEDMTENNFHRWPCIWLEYFYITDKI